MLKIVKSTPFARLVAALVSGILLQWYLQLAMSTIVTAASLFLLLLIILSFLPIEKKFSLRWLTGLLILLLTSTTGAWLTWQKDIRNNRQWAGNFTNGSSMLLTLQEPLVNKPNSYKALASIDAIYIKNEWIPVKGNLLLYFKKDSSNTPLYYGSQIIIQKKLQLITNAGNPGAFDYERYCLFQDISYQLFLQNKDYVLLKIENRNSFNQFLFAARDKVISILQQYIPGIKEQGVAEALLIGYRNDLDKELVQAYSNTGVVHIIAISGLHLGMIYGLLRWIFSLFKRNKITIILKPILILAVLWMFTFIAGAAPSILRSAVMFTFIIIGENINRKSNIYNTLAASAFCLLAFNPFMLWDVGFQLSYAAVLSIVIFMRPIYNLFYFKNKLLDKIWELNSITLAAQVLTLPLVIYTFHQFPLLFFITNFVAVPLSAAILYGELLLLMLFYLKAIGLFIGKILHLLIWLMNSVIENTDRIPFSVWNALQVSVTQALLMLAAIVASAIWLMHKNKPALLTSLFILLLFFALRSVDFINRNHQQKIIVYNIPKYAAIDIIAGRSCSFIGDNALLQNSFLQNFHLKASRTLHRVSVDSSYRKQQFIKAGNKSILILTDAVNARAANAKIPVDIIILSHNPKLYINQLQRLFTFRQLVFDSSNPLWKIEKWKKDCENLHLRFHSVPQQGAFVMDL